MCPGNRAGTRRGQSVWSLILIADFATSHAGYAKKEVIGKPKIRRAPSRICLVAAEDGKTIRKRKRLTDGYESLTLRKLCRVNPD